MFDFFTAGIGVLEAACRSLGEESGERRARSPLDGRCSTAVYPSRRTHRQELGVRRTLRVKNPDEAGRPRLADRRLLKNWKAPAERPDQWIRIFRPLPSGA